MSILKPITLLSFAAVALVAAPANAQYGYTTGCDSVRPARAATVVHDREFERDLREASRLVAQAETLVRDFDSTPARRAVRDAESALEDARAYSRRGRRSAAVRALRSAEASARDAIHEVESLIRELEEFRDSAHAALRSAEAELRHERRWSRVHHRVDDAAGRIEDGERLMRRHEYARARNEFAAAIDVLDEVRDELFADRYHSDRPTHHSWNGHDGGRVVSAGYHRGGSDRYHHAR